METLRVCVCVFASCVSLHFFLFTVKLFNVNAFASYVLRLLFNELAFPDFQWRDLMHTICSAMSYEEAVLLIATSIFGTYVVSKMTQRKGRENGLCLFLPKAPASTLSQFDTINGCW